MKVIFKKMRNLNVIFLLVQFWIGLSMCNGQDSVFVYNLDKSKIYYSVDSTTLYVELNGNSSAKEKNEFIADPRRAPAKDGEGHMPILADITGVAVLTRECHEPVTRLDVSNLTPGLYVVSFRNAQGVVVRKFVKM